MNLNFIVPDINMTFGELKFLGLNRERYAYIDGKRTDTLESRIYNLGSSVQGGQIEVTIPAYVDLKEFDFFKDVELKNPKIMASARANGNFANVNWTVEAEDLVLKGAGSAVSSKPAAVTSGNEKK
ncbi:YdcP family protein [Bacillus paralicheniformis]|uniref:YdcP family protein n=1 Tax=Bacillus paralicheniformis TaxID=1648923 RepID=UPI000BA78C4C|nr:YdcP family protein [Bacillus paralicheniformis]PAC95392.1 hypothetical protein CHH86_19395 [Bacillus paralicheniformis]